MKLDRLQIKLIVGLIIILILYSIVLIIEPKKEDKVILNNNINNEILQIDYPINCTETQNKINEAIEPITKDQLFLMIDQACLSEDYTEMFIYSTNFFENDGVANIFYEGNYSDIIDYINLKKYKEEKIEFITLRNTEDYIWGYFFDSNKLNEKTFVIFDKKMEN